MKTGSEVARGGVGSEGAAPVLIFGVTRVWGLARQPVCRRLETDGLSGSQALPPRWLVFSGQALSPIGASVPCFVVLGAISPT